MLFYMILSFLTNYGLTAPSYSEDGSKVSVSHKISVIGQKEALNSFSNLKRTFSIPSTQETNPFPHWPPSKNTNEFNKGVLELGSLIEIRATSLLGGFDSPLLPKKLIDSSGEECGENCNTGGDANPHDSGFEDSKSAGDTVGNSCTPCGRIVTKEDSEEDDENQEPLLLDVDLDILTGLQSLPTNTLDQLSRILSGDIVSESVPTNSVSKQESSTQCFACSSSPGSTSPQDDRASSNDLGDHVKIDADILRSKPLLKHKFQITKENSNRNIKRVKRQGSKIDISNYSSKDNILENGFRERTNEGIEKSEVLETKETDDINFFSSMESEKTSFNDEEISEKEITKSSDTSMIKDNTNQVLGETLESKKTTTIRDNDREIGSFSKNSVNFVEDKHLDDSESFYKESEFSEISANYDNENAHDSTRSNYHENNFGYEFSETQKVSFKDFSEREFNTGMVYDDDDFDKKMVGNKMLGTEEHRIREKRETQEIISMNDDENHSQDKNMEQTSIFSKTDKLDSAQNFDKNNNIPEQNNKAMEMLGVVEAKAIDNYSPKENDKSGFDNKGFSEKESTKKPDTSTIELDKNQTTDGNAGTGTMQGDNGKSEIIKHIVNSEDDQSDNRAMGVESTTNATTGEHKNNVKNDDQDSNGFKDSQSNALENKIPNNRKESGTSNDDGESSKSEGFEENEQTEPTRSTNEEKGINSITQNGLKDGSSSKLDKQPFKDLRQNFFRNDLYSLTNRRTLPEVPFKRNYPGVPFRQPQFPFYNNFPQSIAGSDLYGSYAYANVGPVPNTGFGSSGVDYGEGNYEEEGGNDDYEGYQQFEGR